MCSRRKLGSFDPCAEFRLAEYCGTCDTDLCNGASQHSVTAIFAFVVPCFAVIISRWFGV
jgi:hypothetical protein